MFVKKADTLHMLKKATYRRRKCCLNLIFFIVMMYRIMNTEITIYHQNNVLHV